MTRARVSWRPMRHLLTPALALLLLSACKKDEAKPAVAASPLAATTWAQWYTVRMGTTDTLFTSVANPMRRNFYKDGRATVSDGGFVTWDGTWSLEGSNLTFSRRGNSYTVRVVTLNANALSFDQFTDSVRYVFVRR